MVELMSLSLLSYTDAFRENLLSLDVRPLLNISELKY